MKHFETFASSFPIAVTVFDIQTGIYHLVTDEIFGIIGYTPGEIKERGYEFMLSLVHPDDIERINEDNVKAADFIHRNPERVKSFWADFEYRIKHKEGYWISAHTRGRAFSLDDEGMVKRIVNFTYDAEKGSSLNFNEMGKIALHSFDNFTELLKHDLKGYVHILEFIVNELVQDSMEIDNLSKDDLKERLVSNSISLSEVSTKLNNLLVNLN